MNQLAETKKEDALFFRENGYFIGRDIILPEHCRELIALFHKEVKPFGGMMLRSSSSQMEIHHFSESGLMTNPILNVHDMDKALFPGFIKKAISMLAANNLQKAVTSLIQDKPVLVQSVFYESSMGTVPHEDSHYFDSDDGRMAGCWIALEEIHEDAGRFCIYPKTHLLGNPDEFPEEVHRAYCDCEKLSLEIVQAYRSPGGHASLSAIKQRQKQLSRLLKKIGLQPFTPILHTGDVIFFSSKTLHSSHTPVQGTDKSRTSLIGHFAPLSKPLILFGRLKEEIQPCEMNGLTIQRSGQSPK